MPVEENTSLMDYEARLKKDRLNKLSFRAWRRGFKEADIILGNFADERLTTMDNKELDLFEILLEVPDQDLYGWIISREATPLEFQSKIMNDLNSYYKNVHLKL
jgi:antitoxin CptB